MTSDELSSRASSVLIEQAIAREQIRARQQMSGPWPHGPIPGYASPLWQRTSEFRRPNWQQLTQTREWRTWLQNEHGNDHVMKKLRPAPGTFAPKAREPRPPARARTERFLAGATPFVFVAIGMVSLGSQFFWTIPAALATAYLRRGVVAHQQWLEAHGDKGTTPPYRVVIQRRFSRFLNRFGLGEPRYNPQYEAGIHGTPEAQEARQLQYDDARRAFNKQFVAADGTVVAPERLHPPFEPNAAVVEAYKRRMEAEERGFPANEADIELLNLYYAEEFLQRAARPGFFTKSERFGHSLNAWTERVLHRSLFGGTPATYAERYFEHRAERNLSARASTAPPDWEALHEAVRARTLEAIEHDPSLLYTGLLSSASSAPRDASAETDTQSPAAPRILSATERQTLHEERGAARFAAMGPDVLIGPGGRIEGKRRGARPQDEGRQSEGPSFGR